MWSIWVVGCWLERAVEPQPFVSTECRVSDGVLCCYVSMGCLVCSCTYRAAFGLCLLGFMFLIAAFNLRERRCLFSIECSRISSLSTCCGLITGHKLCLRLFVCVHTMGHRRLSVARSLYAVFAIFTIDSR